MYIYNIYIHVVVNVYIYIYIYNYIYILHYYIDSTILRICAVPMSVIF